MNKQLLISVLATVIFLTGCPRHAKKQIASANDWTYKMTATGLQGYLRDRQNRLVEKSFAGKNGELELIRYRSETGLIEHTEETFPITGVKEHPKRKSVADLAADGVTVIRGELYASDGEHLIYRREQRAEGPFSTYFLGNGLTITLAQLASDQWELCLLKNNELVAKRGLHGPISDLQESWLEIYKDGRLAFRIDDILKDQQIDGLPAKHYAGRFVTYFHADGSRWSRQWWQGWGNTFTPEPFTLMFVQEFESSADPTLMDTTASRPLRTYTVDDKGEEVRLEQIDCAAGQVEKLVWKRLIGPEDVVVGKRQPIEQWPDDAGGFKVRQLMIGITDEVLDENGQPFKTNQEDQFENIDPSLFRSPQLDGIALADLPLDKPALPEEIIGKADESNPCRWYDQ